MRGWPARDFHALGLGDRYLRSRRATARACEELMSRGARRVSNGAVRGGPNEDAIRIAVIGRPNVGKSTLINRLLGEERVIASEEPGTTRDSILVPFKRDDRDFVLIDTAGIRRRSKVDDLVEKVSVAKTLQAIDDAHVVIMVLDAHESIGEQDASVLGHGAPARPRADHRDQQMGRHPARAARGDPPPTRI